MLFDADALIKLNRAGVLHIAVQVYECLTSDAVYQEVVLRGKGLGFPDASEIERIVQDGMSAQTAENAALPGIKLDVGESSVLALATLNKDSFIIVSDDRRFLTLLEHMGFLYLTPADFIAVMTLQSQLDRRASFEAMERIRPLVSEVANRRAMQRIEEESP